MIRVMTGEVVAIEEVVVTGVMIEEAAEAVEEGINQKATSYKLRAARQKGQITILGVDPPSADRS